MAEGEDKGWSNQEGGNSTPPSWGQQPQDQPAGWGQGPQQQGQPGWGQGPNQQPPFTPPGGGYGNPQWGGQQQPWTGQPQSGTSGKAIAALVLSIVSFVFCPAILAVIGLILASNAKKDIARSGNTLGGLGMAKAATVISIINLCLAAIFIVLIAVGAIFGSNTNNPQGLAHLVHALASF